MVELLPLEVGPSTLNSLHLPFFYSQYEDIRVTDADLVVDILAYQTYFLFRNNNNERKVILFHF